MKLGEALVRVEQLKSSLSANMYLISNCPRSIVVSTLEESNELLRERYDLEHRICETKETTLLEGSPLSKVMAARDMLEEKVDMMERLADRTDLDQKQREVLFEQLKSFRASKDALDINIERCLWETELLGE